LLEVKSLPPPGCEFPLTIGEEPKAKSSKILPMSIKEVLKRYKDVLTDGFSQVLPPRGEVDHKIKVTPGSKLPSKASYQMNQVMLLELKKQLHDLLARWYIRPRKSPYKALVLFLDKKDGKLQMCMDYSISNLEGNGK
jgi:hypothetical protein